MSLRYRGEVRWLCDHPLFGAGDGLSNGYAQIPGPCGRDLTVIFSDGMGWDHVSVSLTNRPPNWAEMNAIKDLFWDAEDVVVQFHPRKSEYVNNHEHCLHLWRSQTVEFPTPDSIMVGVK
jgi:hypothetical protein